MILNKPCVIKDYFKLDLEIQEQLKLAYPNGFSQYLIEFSNTKGEFATALPFETETIKYMIRITGNSAKRIIALDEDYNSNGILKEEVYKSIRDKYSGVEQGAE